MSSEILSAKPISYPPTPPMPPQCLPAAYVDELLFLERHNNAVTLDNWNLRHQLERRQLAEEGYSQILENSSDCIYVNGRNGSWLRLMNRSFQRALHVLPQPPSPLLPSYVVWLSGNEAPLVLSEKEYLSDTCFLTRLHDIPGVEIIIRRSIKTTVTLLRQAVSRHLTVCQLPFYGGWQAADKGKYTFQLLQGKATHQTGCSALFPTEAADMSSAVAAAAATRFWPIFDALIDPEMRWLTFLIYHTAAVFSLLRALGFPLQVGFSFSSQEPGVLSFLEQLFSWYGDGCLSLDMRSQAFLNGILERKDQPVLVQSSWRTQNAAPNAAELAYVLQFQQVRWRKGRDEMPLPLQGLPLILSQSASELTCSPDIITVDLYPEDLNRVSWNGADDIETLGRDYRLTFGSYVQNHIADLIAALKAGCTRAYSVSNGQLEENHVQALGVLFGLDCFLTSFFQNMAPTEPPVSLSHEGHMDMLVNLVARNADGACIDLADQFVSTARALIAEGLLHLCFHHRAVSQSNSEAVYVGSHYLAFTAPAFRLVCQHLSQSRPTALYALKEAGLLIGKPINSSTSQSRITAYNVYGVRQVVPVYLIQRSAFETLGDPLLLDEGEGI